MSPTIDPFPLWNPLTTRAYLIKDLKENKIPSVNHSIAAQWQKDCDQWVARNMQNRNMGLPLDAKPVGPPLSFIAEDIKDWEGLPWVELKQTGAPVGPPCPDLPQEQQFPPFNVDIREVEWEPWYRAGKNDRCPHNYEVTAPPVVGPPPGRYRKVVSPTQDPKKGQFEGWWEKIG